MDNLQIVLDIGWIVICLMFALMLYTDGELLGAGGLFTAVCWAFIALEAHIKLKRKKED